MKQNTHCVSLTLWSNRCLMAVIIGLSLGLPTLLRWYNSFRPLAANQNLAIVIAFYTCVPVAEFALWNLEKLLCNITREQVFVSENVRSIHRVCLCCLLVSLICLPAAFFYAPLIFLSLIMGFLCPVVNVVRQVMKAAVDIREENDLTI